MGPKELLQIFPQAEKKAREEIDKLESVIKANKHRLSEVSHSLQEEKQAEAMARCHIQEVRRNLRPHGSKVSELKERRRKSSKELERKRRELHFLQSQLKVERKEKEELRAIVRNKEEEITQLNQHILKADDEIQALRNTHAEAIRELDVKTRELEVKSARVQELERSRVNLEESIKQERWFMTQVLQSHQPDRMRACSAETQVFSYLRII